MQMTIFYNGQFWVAVIERSENGRLFAVQHIFGPEPQDQEVLDFVNGKMTSLLQSMKRGVEQLPTPKLSSNPKRLAREAAKAIRTVGISTKAQQAISAERDLQKVERIKRSKEKRETSIAFKREIKRQKAKERHRGH